ncbi:MAG TPA: hypothetical protein VH206_01355 [Xanthobacteraceae bacterium]|jgi:type I restriction enzyme S subunit|nr:hypothetical protein [Xanthobacteraceae bacterium]
MMIAAQWPRTPLSDVLVRSAHWVVIDPDKEYRQVTMRLWGKGAVLRGSVKGSSIAATEQQEVKIGQFILSKIDARHGAFGLVPDDLDGALVSSDFPAFDIDAARLLPRFLEWMTKTEWFVSLCRTASEGSTNRVRLREDRFLAQVIPAPAIHEQKRIVAQLDAVAENINKVTTLKREIATDLTSFVTASHFRASKARELELGKLIELHEERIDLEPGREYPQVGIRGFGGGLFAKPAVKTEETTYRYFNRLYPNALVVSQPKGWEGAIGIAGESFEGKYASPEYRTFRCRDAQLRPAYLSYIIRTPWFLNLLSGLSRGQGARRERLRPEMLLALRVPMPQTTDQEQLEGAFAKADQLLKVDTGENLELLIPAMLDRIF